MKKLIVIAFAASSLIVLAGCGLLTPAVESALNNTGIAVLCSLEEEELADPALDADCQKLAGGSGPLTTTQRASVMAHANRAASARAARVGLKPAVDGGAQ